MHMAPKIWSKVSESIKMSSSLESFQSKKKKGKKRKKKKMETRIRLSQNIHNMLVSLMYVRASVCLLVFSIQFFFCIIVRLTLIDR